MTQGVYIDWTPARDDLLRRAWTSLLKNAEIAKLLDTSEGAINNRAAKIGLPCRETAKRLATGREQDSPRIPLRN